MSEITSPTPSATAVEGIAFSREELFVVMRILKARAMPGFETTWAKTNVAGTPTAETLELIQAGTDALIARGFLSVTEPTEANAQPHVELPAPVIALVGVCAFSPYVVRIAGYADGVYQEFYIGQMGALGALHTTPRSNVHLIMPLAGRTGVLKAIPTLLGVRSEVAHGDQLGLISLETIQKGYHAEHAHDSRSVQHVLQPVNPAQQNVMRVVEHALAHDPVWAQLTVATLARNGAVVEQSLFTLASPGAEFMFAPEPSDPSQLGIYAASMARVTDWVKAQL